MQFLASLRSYKFCSTCLACKRALSWIMYRDRATRLTLTLRCVECPGKKESIIYDKTISAISLCLGEYMCPRAHLMNISPRWEYLNFKHALQLRRADLIPVIIRKESFKFAQISYGLTAWNVNKIAYVICNRLFRSWHRLSGKLNYVYFYIILEIKGFKLD